MRQNTQSPALLPSTQWSALRQRIQSPSFADAMDRLRNDVDTFIAQRLAVPEAPGGHYHHYFCPEHGVELQFDAASPTAHLCPVDGAIIRGEIFDASWRWFANNRLSQGALCLAVLWQLETNSAHLDHVVKILTDYATRYTGYAGMSHSVGMSHPNPKPGIATHQTLDEAVWSLPITWAFDLVREEMSKSDIDLVENQLLAPIAEFLVEHHFGDIHNFACWHNAAITTIGLVINRSDLIEFANDGQFGLKTQLREGVLADGLWFEGSFSYHFYTLAALILHLKATAAVPELDLRDHPVVRAMFDAPVQSAYPDGYLPATNDCWYFTGLIHDACHGVPPAPAFYEIGYAWYQDPLFAQVLHRAYQHVQRDTLDALLYGPESIPDQEVETSPSVHLPASGYAILRSPASTAAEQSYVLLKHGPHGGGHGHPDKLNLVLYAHGQRLSADLGTPGYGLDLFQAWYRQTVSHNTLTINGRSQPEAIGMMERFQTLGPFQVADASVEWPTDHPDRNYAGVRMRRIILSRAHYFLDICLVTHDQPCQVDWIYHNIGDLDTPLLLGPTDLFDDAADGYQHLSSPRQASSDQDLSFCWRADGVGVHLFMAGTNGTKIITASSPGMPPTDRRTTLISRRNAMTTAYLSVFHPFENMSSVSDVQWVGRNLTEEGWVGCIVAHSGGTERWLIRLSPDIQFPSWTNDDRASDLFAYCL